MKIKTELEKIIGSNKVSDSPADLSLYSQDMSLAPAGLADAVAWPESTEEVSEIVKWCDANNVPVVPVSSGTHFYGSTIPKQGGVVVDMKNMNKILEIDPKHKFARIQPGVTWSQLTAELDKVGMRAMMPLTPVGNRSVLSDTLDRAVITNTNYDYGEPTQSLEIVWANGDIFRSGSASVHDFPNSPSRGSNPSGPGIDFYRFLQGSQGTMGIVTWMSIKVETKTVIDKVFFAPVEDLDYAQKFLFRVLPRRIGQEVVLLNNLDLACILAENDDEINDLCAKLPTWTLCMILSGGLRRPEEKIAYEEKFLTEVLYNEYPELRFKNALPGFPGLSKKMLAILKSPQTGKLWKTRPLGGCSFEDIFFIARPEKVKEYTAIMEAVTAKYKYPTTYVGAYIQPIEHNRACQVEFTLFYNPEDEGERAEVAKIAYEAAVAMMDKGAFFTRPYGEITPLIYDRAGNYTATLKQVKKVFDPNNILNPGTLCF